MHTWASLKPYDSHDRKFSAVQKVRHASRQVTIAVYRQVSVGCLLRYGFDEILSGMKTILMLQAPESTLANMKNLFFVHLDKYQTLLI